MQESKQIRREIESEEEESQTEVTLKNENYEELTIPFDMDFELISQPSGSAIQYQKTYRTDFEAPEPEEIKIEGSIIPDYHLTALENEQHGYVSRLNTAFEGVEVEYPDITEYTGTVIDIALHSSPNLEKKEIKLNTNLGEFGSSPFDHTGTFLLEEILEMKGGPYFPRGKADIGNGPIAIIIGEENEPWHEPVLYILRELFREITETFPTIYFRKPANTEDITEDIIDSTEPHSLEKFKFENRIEFLDARDEPYEIEEFFSSLQNRFEASYLQRFGIFVIALKKEYVDEVPKYLALQRMRVIKFPDNKDENLDENFQPFCRGIVGMLKGEDEKDFRRLMEKFNETISKTVKDYSVFVKQGGISENDREDEQYPYKVAIFEYLIKKEIAEKMKDDEKKMRKYLSNRKKLYEYIQEKILGDENHDAIIEIEKSFGSVIPDIIYNSTDADGKSKRIFIEFETLIGTKEPMKKIDHSIEKYAEHKTEVGISENDDIWIVLRPISAIIHFEDLREREYIYNKILYKKDFKVHIKVLYRTEDRWAIEDLEKFGKIMKSMIGKEAKP